MSEFSDFMSEGFDELAAELGSTLAFRGQTARVVASNVLASQELRETGLWEQGSEVVEMARADFRRLKLEDRCLVRLTGGDRPARDLQLFVIEQDDADPTVRLHLKPTHQ